MIFNTGSLLGFLGGVGRVESKDILLMHGEVASLELGVGSLQTVDVAVNRGKAAVYVDLLQVLLHLLIGLHFALSYHS